MFIVNPASDFHFKPLIFLKKSKLFCNPCQYWYIQTFLSIYPWPDSLRSRKKFFFLKNNSKKVKRFVIFFVINIEHGKSGLQYQGLPIRKNAP